MTFPAVPRFPVQPLLLGVGFALLVAIGTATVWLAEQSAQDARSVVHTINVQEKLSNLLLNVRRAESGQRGFLLTGRQQYLLDYRDAAPAVETYLAELRTLMSDNPDRGPVLDQMDATARTKMTELAKTIELQASGQHEAAVALVQSDDGFKSMNGLRLLVERTLADEERLLLARSAASRRNDARLLAVSLAGMALVVLIGALSVFLVQRTSRQRESARNELAATNANLERIVAHRTADLTEANEEIQRFAYIVSHDLRSPLVNIMGFTTELEALRSDIFEEIAKLREQAGVAAAHADARESGGASTDPLGTGFDEAITFIKTSITKMDRLINAVLKLSREGRRDFKPEEIDMNALHGVDRTNRRASRHGAGSDRRRGRSSPGGKRPARSGAGILQSRRQCSQIWSRWGTRQNRDQGPYSAGACDIRGPRQWSGHRPARSSACIRALSPFGSAGPAGRRDWLGACPRAGAPARRHDEPYVGTWKRQRLHRHAAAPLGWGKQERCMNARMAEQPVTIIMVEDDEGHARLIEKNIRRAGVNNPIRPFTNGSDAVKFLFGADGTGIDNKGSALLILLDLNLPDMSGVDILKRLKENEHLKRSPVVVLTTTDDAVEIKRCYDLGCNVYITKPVNYENFAHAIRQLGLFFTVIQVPAAV